MSRVTESTSRIGARDVLGLAWPVIVSMLSYTMMSVADAVFVGRLGTAPLAAVGLSITIVFLTRAYPMGVLQGVRVLTAQRTGAEDHDAARRLAAQAVWMSLGMGLVSIALIPLGGRAFTWMGADGEVHALATTFFVVRMLGAPTDLLLWGVTGWFQGRGDTRTPMYANVSANVLNVVLDAVLVFGLGPIPAMGIAGAAWATNASRLAGAAYLLWRMGGQVHGVSWRPDRALFRRVFDLGHPLGVADLLDVGSFTLFAAILTVAGEVQLAAHVVVVRIVSMSFLPGYGIGSATGVLVGQSVGARRPDLAGQSVKAGLVLAVGLMTMMGVLFITLPGPLLGVFGAEPEVVAVGAQLLVVAATFQVFDAVVMVLHNALNGAGDTRFVMRTTVTASWVAKLPVAWLLALPLGYGAVGAWLGFTSELVVVAAVFVYRLRSGRWLVLEPEPEPVPVVVA